MNLSARLRQIILRWQLMWTSLVATERERLEGLVSERTQALAQSREMFRLIAESTKAIPFTLDLSRGSFIYVGSQAAESGFAEETWHLPGALERLIPRERNPETRQLLDACDAGHFEFVATLARADGRRAELRWTGTCEVAAGIKTLRGLILDVTEFRRLGRELAAAQKLESVGRLAAGVAHEINTPVQFVFDNVHFVRGTIKDIMTVIEAYRALEVAVRSGGDATAAASAASAAEKTADLDYIIDNAIPALESSIEGLKRIAAIVSSMKEFAHPDRADKSAADINHAIESTLIIARNEYKHVAELETDFAPLPPVYCYLGEINQAILNLLINAAHAIGDVVGDTGATGKLTLRTRLDGGQVEISIGDTGTGIPENIRDKIFDPFFTTKEVGRGTGQGLALVHSIVVGKHGGTVRFETECGKGTTFFIRLPLGQGAVDDQKAA